MEKSLHQQKYFGSFGVNLEIFAWFGVVGLVLFPHRKNGATIISQLGLSKDVSRKEVLIFSQEATKIGKHCSLLRSE